MKILFVTTSFPQISNPNSGFFIKKLIDSFSDHIEVTVVTPADTYRAGVLKEGKYTQVNFWYGPSFLRTLAHSPGGMAEIGKKKNFTLLLLPVLLLAEFITVLKWARKADLIQANWSINGIISGLAGKILRKPVITTLRGSDVNKAAKSKIFSFLLFLCLKLSSRIVTVNQALKKRIKHQFPWYVCHIDVFENGIENDFFEIERVVPDIKKIITILVIGNLTVNKSVDTIITSLSTISDYNVKTDIVGDGPERKNLEKICDQMGLGKKVVFHGSVDASARIPFFEKADILVFASLSEGRPNVIIEAMASGLAIVASDIEGVKDLLNDGEDGLLFCAGNPADLSRQLERLFENPALMETTGSHARDKLRQMGLTWPKTASNYEALYRQIIEQKAT